MEEHGDVGLIALALEDEFPVIAEAGDEADVEAHPAVRDVAGLDEVDDRKEHQGLVGRDAPLGGAGGVEVGQFAEPMSRGFRVQFKDRRSGLRSPTDSGKS